MRIVNEYGASVELKYSKENLCAFFRHFREKLRKTTIIFIVSVRMKQLVSAGRIVMKFGMWDLTKMCPKNSSLIKIW
jgi:hypothetical protein